jgi:hypothetical protein
MATVESKAGFHHESVYLFLGGQDPALFLRSFLEMPQIPLHRTKRKDIYQGDTY